MRSESGVLAVRDPREVDHNHRLIYTPPSHPPPNAHMYAHMCIYIYTHMCVCIYVCAIYNITQENIVE